MSKLTKYVFLLTTMFSFGFVLNAETVIDKKSLQSSLKRVPAEWEPQEATWLQWPGRWEKDYEEAIAKISDIISRYQTLHILYGSDKILKKTNDPFTLSKLRFDAISMHRLLSDSSLNVLMTNQVPQLHAMIPRQVLRNLQAVFRPL